MHPLRLSVSLLAVAGVLWGTGGLIGSAFGAAAGLSPVAVACYRLGAGGALLLLARRCTPSRRGGIGHCRCTPSRRGGIGHRRCTPSRRGGIRYRRRLPGGSAALRRVVVTGLLAAVFQACYFGAVARTSVGLATFVAIGTAPVVVLAVDRLHGRRAPRRVLLGGLLALAGLALLVGTPGGGADPLAGALLAVVSGSGFAVMTLLGARPVPGLDAATGTGAAFLVGAAVLAPFAGLGLAPTPTSLGLLVLLGIVPTALAYAAYFTGLRTAPAGVGALLALLEPLTAAGLAALLLGERLSPTQLVGAALLMIALALVATGRRPAAPSSHRDVSGGLPAVDPRPMS